MEMWKKYEGYVDGEKRHTIKLYNGLKKRLAAGMVLTTVLVTTLTGCSFGSKVKDDNNLVNVKFSSITEEADVKFDFVNESLNIISKYPNFYENLYSSVHYDLDKAYLYKDILDPSVNELHAAYSEEQLKETEYKMLEHLDKVVEKIDAMSKAMDSVSSSELNIDFQSFATEKNESTKSLN